MDDHLIFIKTKAGEAALQERTRLVRPDLRRVLILVDGRSAVTDVKQQLGDAAMVESSLMELLRLGLIEKIREEAVLEVASVQPLEATSFSRARVKLGSCYGTLREKIAQWRQKRRAAAKEKAFRRVYETPTEADTIEQIKIKRVRRGPRRVIGWPLLLAMMLAGGALLLTLLAILFPYQYYLPEMERRLSLALQDPVKIAKVHFSVMPYPNITLEHVSVGADAYATARVVRLIPNPLYLFTAMPAVSSMQLDGLLIRSKGLGPSAHWFGKAGEEGLLTAEVHLNDLAIEIGSATLDGLSGTARMSAHGGLDKLLLANAEQTLHLEVTPAASGFRLAVIGNNWMMPFKPGFMFEYFEAQGEVSPGLLNFSRVSGRMYEGLVEGTAQFDWSQGKTLLVSDIKLGRASIRKLFFALHPDLALEGDISGKLHLESRAESVAHLVDSLRVDGDFLVAQGIINRFDLVEAVRSNRETRGGFTRFERFSGSLQLENQGYRLTKLKISSGLMQATGRLDIGPSQELSGVMEVTLKGSAARVSGSVSIAGTLISPRLSPLSGNISP